MKMMINLRTEYWRLCCELVAADGQRRADNLEIYIQHCQKVLISVLKASDSPTPRTCPISRWLAILPAHITELCLSQFHAASSGDFYRSSNIYLWTHRSSWADTTPLRPEIRIGRWRLLHRRPFLWQQWPTTNLLGRRLMYIWKSETHAI